MVCTSNYVTSNKYFCTHVLALFTVAMLSRRDNKLVCFSRAVILMVVSDDETNIFDQGKLISCLALKYVRSYIHMLLL